MKSFFTRNPAPAPRYRYRRGTDPRCAHVCLSDRAYLAIHAEVAEHRDTETGGFLLGHLAGGVWYVTEVVDAGIKDTVYDRAYFRYDPDYVNHLCGKIKRIYAHPPVILGFYHRHPGSMDTFSLTDLRTIDEHVRESRYGVLSMLVNIDPALRMTFYYASHERELIPVPCQVGDAYFPEALLALADPEAIFARMHPTRRFYGEAPRSVADPAPFARSLRILPRPAAQPAADVLRGACAAAESGPEPEAGQSPADPGAAHRAVFQAAAPSVPVPAPGDRAQAQPGREGAAQPQPAAQPSPAPQHDLVLDRPAPLNQVSVPEELLALTGYEGPLYGYAHPESGCFTVLGWAGHEPAAELAAGPIGAVGRTVLQGVEGVYGHDGLTFRHVDQGRCTPLKREPYQLLQNLFSRNAGLLESDYLLESCAVISGLGSVGFLAALQLARAGVGRFVVCDPDVLAIENVCRHQLDLTYVGAYKAEAAKACILRINPAAQVYAFVGAVQNLPGSALREYAGGRRAVFIGAGDNRLCNAYANDLAIDLGAPFVSIGFWERAGVLSCFRWIPGRRMTRYRCAFRQAVEAAAVEKNRYYVGEQHEAQIEAGIGVDVTLGTSIGVKVALDLLNLDNPNYTQRLVPYTGQLLLFANSHLKQVAGRDAALLFRYPLQVARAVGVADCDCPVCREAQRTGDYADDSHEAFELDGVRYASFDEMVAAMAETDGDVVTLQAADAIAGLDEAAEPDEDAIAGPETAEPDADAAEPEAAEPDADAAGRPEPQ